MPNQIKKVSFKPGLPLEIEVIPIAATIARHPGEITTPHRAAFYNIFWVQQGAAEYLVDFEPVPVPANSLVFFNKDRVKALDRDHPHDGRILLFTDDFFARTPEDTQYLHSSILFNDLLEVPVIGLEDAPVLKTLFREIEAELAGDPDALQPAIAHSLLRTLLLLAERARRRQGFTELTKGPDFDYTVQFKNLVERFFKQEKSVGGYAARLNISEKKLTAATTRTLGKSPKALIDEVVLLEAKRLLVHTSQSTKEVGYELGFEDPAYFVKYFRKHTNRTPIEFRESYTQR